MHGEINDGFQNTLCARVIHGENKNGFLEYFMTQRDSQLGVLVKIGFQAYHKSFIATIQSVYLHQAASVGHGPADISAHDVEELPLGHGPDGPDPLAGLLEPFKFNLSGDASHCALVLSTRTVD